MTRNVTATALLILSTALAAPLAFAQQTPPTDPAAQQTPPTTGDAAATTAAPAAPSKKSWNDLDSNKNGSLDKTEAASIPSLQAVFEQADANADGALTGDEYKTWLAVNGKGQSKSPTQK